MLLQVLVLLLAAPALDLLLAPAVQPPAALPVFWGVAQYCIHRYNNKKISPMPIIVVNLFCFSSMFFFRRNCSVLESRLLEG